MSLATGGTPRSFFSRPGKSDGFVETVCGPFAPFSSFALQTADESIVLEFFSLDRGIRLFILLVI